MKVERRVDLTLRHAIDRIQRVAMTELSVKSLYTQLLKECLSLTGFRYGCALTLSRARGDFEASLEPVVAINALGRPLSLSDDLERCALPAEWRSVLHHHRACFYEDGVALSRLCGFSGLRPAVNNGVIFPLIDENHVFALVACCNGSRSDEDGHDKEAMVSRLQPLWVSFVCVLRARMARNDLELLSHASLESQQLNALLNASFNGVITVNASWRIVSFNRACEVWFEIPQNKAVGQDVSSFLPRHFAQESAAKWGKGSDWPCTSPVQVHHGVRGRRSGGRHLLFDVAIYHTRHHHHLYTTFVLDESRKRLASLCESQESLRRFKTVCNLAPVGILQVDAQWDCVYVNDQWTVLSGLAVDESLHHGWVNALHPDDVEPVMNALRASMSCGQDYLKECRLLTSLGKILWVKMSARALYTERGEIDGFLGTVADISDHRRVESHLRAVASTDLMTGLSNRAHFLETLIRAVKLLQAEEKIAVLYIDLDGFKSVNDTFGHQAGDELLREVASRLKGVVRRGDTVARMGGDEFTILLSALRHAHDASHVAEKVLERLKEPVMISEAQKCLISCSIGISIGQCKMVTAEVLIQQADTALYRAKRNGKSTYHYFTPELDAMAKARTRIKHSLQNAQERDELCVHYQPLVCLHDGEIEGFEALLRWRHEVLGAVAPHEFVPIMEEAGLMESIGQWVLMEACQTLCHWRRQEFIADHVSVSVNLSARQLRQSDFIQVVKTVLSETGLPAENLVLEITEAIVLDDGKVLDLLHALKALGVRLSLDDCGTGYLSLPLLARMPLDNLKIDRSFISCLPGDRDSDAVVNAVLALAHSLGLRVVAEGVDSREKLDYLKKTERCDSYQGFIHSEPTSNEAIEQRFFLTA
ncbi:MAG: EAL domain-containing protein [Gammaproteobacteria bacterium]